MDQDKNKDMESEMAFMTAMRAFRAARDSGDAEATAAAEEALRNLVRDELVQGKGD